jgi:hypothetical protein
MRAARILARHEAGEKQISIAASEGLSKERVWQLVKRARAERERSRVMTPDKALAAALHETDCDGAADHDDQHRDRALAMRVILWKIGYTVVKA